MPYDVNFTNSPLKITVQDQVINNSTSLSFVGKNYAGYGKIIADNFLHLLENFANITPPLNPVEGQLWYDSTSNVNMLKVFNGTTWNPAGAIKKATTQPLLTESARGDLWVNPTTNQLFMFAGSSWDLVGPQYSSGLKTGQLVEIMVDTLNIDHTVLVIYAENEKIAIISQSDFIPKLVINGFSSINRGINLSENSDSLYLNKLWGTASSADALVVNNLIVSSTNFLRSDVSSTTSKSLNIQANEGIKIGSQLHFNIGADDALNLINLKASAGKNVKFEVVDTNQVVHTGLFIKSNSSVGVNTDTPTETLDVNGNILLNGNVTIKVLEGNPAVLTTKSQISPTRIYTVGTLEVGSTSKFKNTLSLYKSSAGAVLLPDYTGYIGNFGAPLYDIGSEDLPFRDIYAQTFHGSFSGTIAGDVTGSVDGSSTSLKTPRSFSLEGDVTCTAVPFNGTASVKFQTEASPDLISAKPAADISELTDEILTYRPRDGLQRTSKELFLKSVPAVPVGAIFPYAGIYEPPAGYLLCDGSEVLISKYPELYEITKFQYRPRSRLIGVSTFALPDLRGRFPLGKDDMDNGLLVPVASTTITPIEQNAGGNRNGDGVDPAQRANRVHHVSATRIGGESGSETFGLPAVNDANDNNNDAVTSSTTGSKTSIMNPYQTINYIIFTGVLQ